MSKILLNPNAKRGKTALQLGKAMLAVIVLMFFVQIYTLIFYINLFDGTLDLQGTVSFGLIAGFSALAYLVIWVLFIIFFIMWFRRAYYNLHQFYGDLEFTEGWAAGAWFVPFLNLVRPFKIAKELNARTEELLVKNSLGQVNKSRSQVINLWWAFFLIGNIVSNISSRMANSTDFDMLILSQYIGLAGSLLSVVAIVLCLKFIQQTTRMEKLLTQISDVDTALGTLDNNDILDAGI